ncbi:hypothetical protein Acr_17g0005610 [Actinidia rufa]|uniref:Uncharacterized protein n=1 Tax=Actinidia rufa TaxID=165716 RepID=A0A7J0G2J2_9ERIC|nr:hypothetical protein Acr_17g0005610 [Actinidia rufa]
MFGEVTVEDLENSLPSWISDYLEDRSYMETEDKEYPTSPREDPVETIKGLHVEETRPPPEKETNTMTQDELDHLAESCSFPAGVQVRLPESGETIMLARLGKVAFYESAFHSGRKFALSLNEFRSLFNLLKNPRPDSGWLYFKVKLGHSLIGEYPSNVKGWKKKFFFVSNNDLEFAHGQSRELGVLRVLSQCNAGRAFLDRGLEDFVAQMLKSGEFYAVKDIFHSKAFLRCFSLDQQMASSGEDYAEEGKNVGTIRYELRRGTLSYLLDDILITKGNIWLPSFIKWDPSSSSSETCDVGKNEPEEAHPIGQGERGPLATPEVKKKKPLTTPDVKTRGLPRPYDVSRGTTLSGQWRGGNLSQSGSSSGARGFCGQELGCGREACPGFHATRRQEDGGEDGAGRGGHTVLSRVQLLYLQAVVMGSSLVDRAREMRDGVVELEADKKHCDAVLLAMEKEVTGLKDKENSDAAVEKLEKEMVELKRKESLS